MNTRQKILSYVLALAAVAAVALIAGILWSRSAGAAEDGEGDGSRRGGTRVVYPKRSKVDLEGVRIEGEVRNPGDFYFQRRPEERYGSLVQRRKNFHREMLRDVVLSK